MTDGSSLRKKSRPALASRILVGGASVAATIGLVGGMAAASRSDASVVPVPPDVERPMRIVVVHKKAPSVRRARSVTTTPRIIRRSVPRVATKRPPATTTSTRAS